MKTPAQLFTLRLFARSLPVLTVLASIGLALSLSTITSVLIFVFSSSEVQAYVSPKRAAALKETLTPMGALKEGNATATIPAWDGGLLGAKIPFNYTGDGHHPDPYPKDKPLYTITHENLSYYQEQVPLGLQALIKRYPDTFKLPVYPTRRSHSAPDWVYQNSRRNAVNAHLAKSGNGITGAFGGVPFPIPLNNRGQYDALQIIWNHIMRWRGTHVVRDASEVAVHRNGAYSLVTSRQQVYFKYYDPAYNWQSLDNMIFFYLSFTKRPARLAGGILLVHETLDQGLAPRRAWGYNAGQRRVRRAPNLNYDAPIAVADGLRTADDTDMYNGSPDRYHWRLVGKKEMIIPYNNYTLDSASLTYDQLLQRGHIDPDHTRYELHRVWVIEATLKPNQRHIYTKRTFYIDEDSWSIAVADQYDRRGELWRVSVAYLKNYYEVPTTWSALDTFHDLHAGRYHVQFLDNEQRQGLDFSQAIPRERLFKPSQLRRLGRR